MGDRHGLIEPFAGQHEAADMLGEMARETDQSVGQIDGLPDGLIGGIEPGLTDVIAGQAVFISPDRLGKRGGHVGCEPQSLADFADGPAGAIVDDGCANCRTMASVALIDVLDDVLASFVLEIDIDIRRLVPLLRNEAGKEQFRCRWIDLGNAEAKADRAVGRTAASLRQNMNLAAKTDEIGDNEKVAGKSELVDQRQLFLEQGANFFGNVA